MGFSGTWRYCAAMASRLVDVTMQSLDEIDISISSFSSPSLFFLSSLFCREPREIRDSITRDYNQVRASMKVG